MMMMVIKLTMIRNINTKVQHQSVTVAWGELYRPTLTRIHNTQTNFLVVVETHYKCDERLVHSASHFTLPSVRPRFLYRPYTPIHLLNRIGHQLCRRPCRPILHHTHRADLHSPPGLFCSDFD